MNRFAIAVVAAGLAVSSALASQGRGQFGGEGGSAPLVPEVIHLAGTTYRGGNSYRSPGVMGAWFELMGTEKVTVLEEHYRKQLIGAGWKMESTGGDANGAFSRFALAAGPGIPRVGTLSVAPLQTGRVSVAIRLVESTPPAPPPPAKTESEMMDWMLRQLPRPSSGETPAAASALPTTFPMELLPARFKSSRILTSGSRVTVAGTVDNTAPTDLAAFFLGLRKAGWTNLPSRGFSFIFALGELCRNATGASFVFNVEPKRVVMAAVTTDDSPDGRCASQARLSSRDFFVPIVVVPSDWAPVIDGGGGSTHWRSGIRVSTSAPIASVLSDFESQITAVGYKAVSRTNDAIQHLVRFESTPEAGSPSALILSLTKLPWSSQIDAVFDVIGSPVR